MALQRLDKVIASTGRWSRREVKELVRAGRVAADGVPVGAPEEKYDRDGKKHTGTALLIRRALPNATFIGFTGTPISAEDRSTREVFGDYIDVYDMTQAVEDDATRPVFYESRVVALKLDQGILAKVDDEYEKLTEQANAETIDASKRNFANLDAVLGAPEVIDALCQDIVEHYETNRAHELTGKAMIVAYSRPAAMAIYQRICELRPSWKDEGKLGVVMTMGNQDPEWWFDVVGNKAHVKEMAKRFKDDADPLKIVIVVDMWLTGFDVPSLATMYVYKPMRGYNLMQAIARVNRVYKDKVGGLVVDYVGIANALKRAMKDYTKRDQKKYGDMDIGKTAYPKFLEKLAVCRDKMFGYDYSEFMSTESAARRSELITGGVNHILAPGDEDITRDFVEQESCSKPMDSPKVAQQTCSASRLAISRLFESLSFSSPSRAAPAAKTEANLPLSR